MTNKEAKEIYKTLNNIYCGILANYPDFQHGDIKDIVYDSSYPHFRMQILTKQNWLMSCLREDTQIYQRVYIVLNKVNPSKENASRPAHREPVFRL